ncbi:hypothetical protein EMGBS6_15320 [Opitutia bacterium]|nr:hypothetical protein EMGBS6_15320 [Opitutae bacterium]
MIHFNEACTTCLTASRTTAIRTIKATTASPTNGGRPNVSVEQYEKNLSASFIARLKQTGAKLIFGSTTPVPESDAAKYVKDSELPYTPWPRRSWPRKAWPGTTSGPP